MVAIRILIISNLEGGADQLVESVDFEGATVVSKDVEGDAKALAKAVATSFASGKYDFAVAMTDNTVGANIAFNKYEGIVAMVLHDPEEAKDAKEQGVNVIVLKQGNMKQIEDIVKLFSKGRGLQLRIKMPNMPKTQLKAPEAERREAHEKQLVFQRQPIVQKNQVKPILINREYDDSPEPSKRPGFRGWIKDSLGIIDVENPKKEKKKQSYR